MRGTSGRRKYTRYGMDDKDKLLASQLLLHCSADVGRLFLSPRLKRRHHGINQLVEPLTLLLEANKSTEKERDAL